MTNNSASKTSTGSSTSPSQKPQSNKSNGGSHAETEIKIRDADGLQETLLNGWHWLEQNAAAVGAAVLILLVLLSGYSMKNWWQDRQDKKAQEAFYGLESKYNKIKEGFERAKLQAVMPKPTGKEEKQPLDLPASGDLEKDYGSLVGEIESFVQTHSGTSAGVQGAILLAETYSTYGKADQALAMAALGAKNTTSSSLLGALTRAQWGSLLADKGDCQEALKIWKQVLDTQSAKFIYNDLRLRSGLCYEKINDSAKALEMYQLVSAENGPESPLATLAKGLKRALEIKSKSSNPGKQG